MKPNSPLPGREDAIFVGDAELAESLQQSLAQLPPPQEPKKYAFQRSGRTKAEIFKAVWTPDDKRDYVDYALNIMAADSTVSAGAAAGRAANEMRPNAERKPTGNTIINWAKDQARPLTTDGHARQRVAAQRSGFYARERRESQRLELLELIDMEIKRTREALTKKRSREKSDEMIAVNFAQRIQALANAHGTVAGQSRSDQLHGVRMGDVDPGSPANNLDDWDGDPTRLPTDIEERIVDIEASRRRAQTLSGSA